LSSSDRRRRPPAARRIHDGRRLREQRQDGIECGLGAGVAHGECRAGPMILRQIAGESTSVR
jgi:hypothetical protein